jgi:hypothetical protein
MTVFHPLRLVGVGMGGLCVRAAMKNLAAIVLVVCVVVPALPAAAAPSLTVDAEQFQSPAKALSPVQLWDTEWRMLIDARPDGAPLTRLEFRARFLDDRPQSHAGGVDLQSNGEPVAGRLLIDLPARVDYDRPFEVRLRVHDSQGDTSAWAVARFPPKKSIRPLPEDNYVVSVGPVGGEYTIVKTVEFEASESTRMSAVREDLEYQARAAGGDAAVGLRLAKSSHDTYVFAADVIRYTTRPEPTPTEAAKATDRVLGRIAIPYEAR